MDKTLEFFKPTITKVLIFILLGIILFSFSTTPKNCNDCFQTKGLPLTISTSGGLAGFEEIIMTRNLIIDIISWYIIAGLIILFSKKVKK